jgi:membrane-bound lytic murein transglycosylase D
MINAVKGRRALALGVIAVLITVGVSPLAAQECRSDWETCDHARVEHYIKQFTKRTWRGWLHGVWERSWIYADHIGAALERRGLPQELRLLPVVESAYREDAVSPQGAVGLWQITRVGASGYPLRMGGPIDERRDFWKATEVALDTLATNHDRFGDWLLAIAAYNAGPGGVQRAINRAGTTDFWELRRSGALPRETAEFVPRFLAAVRVFAQPERYGLSEMEPITWVRVGAGGRADLRKLAAHTGMDLQLLRTANAELSSLFTPSDARVEPVVIGSNDARAADMRGYWLKVPEEHAEEVRALLQERTQLFDFIEHEVRPGETFWDMAKRYGSSVELIVDENPDLHPRRLRLSQTVIIPLLAGAPIVQPQPLTMEWFAQSGSGAVYEVEYGDSLWGIARTHGVTVEALAASNGRSPDDIIKPGETLMVQAGSTLSSA